MVMASCIAEMPELSTSAPQNLPPIPPRRGEPYIPPPITTATSSSIPASAFKRSPVVTAQKLSCLSGDNASVTIYSPTDAALSFKGKTYEMKRIVSTLGAKYEGSGATYWNKGIDASIFLGGTGYACSLRPSL